MSMFEVGELVRIRARGLRHGWYEPKTGVVMGPAAEDPWEFGDDDRLPPRYVPVLIDGTVVKVDEMKIQRVEQS